MTDREVLALYRPLLPFLAQLCGPACEVFSGVPLLVYGLSLFHAVDDEMGLWIDLEKQGHDGWRVSLTDSNEGRLAGWLNPWIGDVPAAPAKVVVASDGRVTVFVRRIETTVLMVYFS